MHKFDWSAEVLEACGIDHRMRSSHLKLCASRAFCQVAYARHGHEVVFDAHTDRWQKVVP